LGILINNPFATFACAGSTFGENTTASDAKPPKRFFIGSEDGMPEVWFLLADSLAELTRRYQRLVGTTPMPPLWALGHHQCRWGYESAEDLLYTKEQMARHCIPNSGLWLDIDYMDGFRVFTWNRSHFPVPAKDIAKLQEDGQRVLRPLIYDFRDAAGIPLDRVSDQFMVGPSIMQAPITHGNRHNCARDVVLPEGHWYDLLKGAWISGGRTIRVEMDRFQTPAYVRAGAIVPMLPTAPTSHRIDMATVDMHCFLRDGQSASVCYRADDGETFAYRKGKRSSLTLSARLEDDTVFVEGAGSTSGWRDILTRIVLYPPARNLVANGRRATVTGFTWKATGTDLPCLRSTRAFAGSRMG
jgi:alpha-glucosidase (family GH31 glycosyl hydrolase)